MIRTFMKKSLVIVSSLFLLIASAGTVFAAYNHELYSTIWIDGKAYVYYSVQSTFDSTTKTQIGTAMSQWNDILPTTFLNKSVTETTDTSPSNNGINTITKNAYGANSYLGEHLPYTNSNGRVVESDIRINTSHAWANSKKPGYYDIQSTMTHELGHAVRVGHSSTYEDTMYTPGAKDSDYRRTITSADEEAAQDSYDRW